MAHPNIENLVRVSSPEEAREKGRKGGIASGEARRRKADVIAQLRILLETEFQTSEGKKTGAEHLASTLIESAIKGKNLKAVEMILDRIYGKANQPIAVSEDAKKPMASGMIAIYETFQAANQKK